MKGDERIELVKSMCVEDYILEELNKRINLFVILFFETGSL